MTTYQRNEERLSRLFFGQSGKSVEQMEGEFRELASMHDRHAQDIERDRAAAVTIIADMLFVAKDGRYTDPMRAAFLHAAVVLASAYQDSFPGAVSPLRQGGQERSPGGQMRLSQMQTSVLVSANAGLVSYVRTADGLKFFRAGVEVTQDALAVFGLGLITVTDDLEGSARMTEKGLGYLR